MIRTEIVNETSELSDLKTEYLAALESPLDAYWEEALIGLSDHYELTLDGERAGFYCVNSAGQLVGFFLIKEASGSAEAAFDHILENHGISEALAGTNDPLFFSMCSRSGSEENVHTLLFGDQETKPRILDRYKDLTFGPAGERDLEKVLEHYVEASGAVDNESIEAAYDGLRGYVRSVMDRHRIFILSDGKELVATSECRLSKTQEPFADVGMIVAKDHRRKGLGSYILARTKQYCYETGCRPICSCEAENIGSRKAIANAGFVIRNRIIKFRFANQLR